MTLYHISCRTVHSFYKWRVFRPDNTRKWHAEIYRTTDQLCTDPEMCELFKTKALAKEWAQSHCDALDEAKYCP